MVNHAKYFTPRAEELTMPYLVKLRSPTGEHRPALNLGEGLPSPAAFPFTEATFKLPGGEVLHLPQSLMNVALQYGKAGGVPQFVAQLRDLTEQVIKPPHMDERGLVVTGGANNAIYLIVQTFLDAGDCIFLQESTYSDVLDALRGMSLNVVSIPNDSQGLRSDLLGEALSKTPASKRKLLYVIPNGDNPTGITMSESRRREVYNLACKYDLLITEDDPYYFLQYGPQAPSPTFLGLDTEGRVLRVDTFAKTLSPGLRIGYVIADKPFTDKLAELTAEIMSSAPIMSQVVLSELLRHWGIEGFLKYARTVREGYKGRRDVLLQAANKHLSGLCEWTEGDGFFLWLKVLGVEDATHLVVNECTKKGLYLVPGNGLMWDTTRPSPYIRVSHSLVTPEDADEGFSILAEVIKSELEKKKKRKEKETKH